MAQQPSTNLKIVSQSPRICCRQGHISEEIYNLCNSQQAAVERWYKVVILLHRPQVASRKTSSTFHHVPQSPLQMTLIEPKPSMCVQLQTSQMLRLLIECQIDMVIRTKSEKIRRSLNRDLAFPHLQRRVLPACP
ncbi:hypothetical protein FIBSPDRAFT_210434 [Athelia psychrophila]|uniref:Uncharacterized protein n=1 Tax=Athelia psychrophila TaxID=1759441 RepID=A0A166WRM3_9AGAM|nr:hypothetical protein FIBSPDRAFT_210434 [Fibularhizoctonia sp. CBS 109695]